MVMAVGPSRFNKSIVTFSFFLLALICVPVHCAPASCPDNTIKVLSWNIRDLGKSKNATELSVISSLVKSADLIAIQEVVAGKGGPEAVAKLAQRLRLTHSDWQHVISAKTTGDGPERYAFLWRASRINHNSSYLSPVLADPADREPFVGHFFLNHTGEHGSSPLSIVNFHAVPTKKDPQHEIIQLDEVKAVSDSEKVLVLGDFNLGHSQPAFDELRQLGFKAHVFGKTALKRARKNGEHLTHPYDNIFSKGLSVCASGIIDFSHGYDTLKEARYISDHLPIWVAIPVY